MLGHTTRLVGLAIHCGFFLQATKLMKVREDLAAAEAYIGQTGDALEVRLHICDAAAFLLPLGQTAHGTMAADRQIVDDSDPIGTVSHRRRSPSSRS